MADYFRHTPDPERGWALAAMTGMLSFRLCQARPDPRPHRGAHGSDAVLPLVGLRRRPLRDGGADVAGAPSSPCGEEPRRTVRAAIARRWPGGSGAPPPLALVPPGGRGLLGHNNPPPHVPALSEVVHGLATASKSDLPALVASGSTCSTRRRAGRSSSSSPASCASASRRGWPRPRSRASATSRRTRSSMSGTGSSRLTGAVRLGRGPGPRPESRRPGAVPAADALAPARGGGLRQARCRRLHGRVEMGRHPPPGRLRPAPRRAARAPHLFAHRRGRLRRLSRTSSRRSTSRARSTASS